VDRAASCLSSPRRDSLSCRRQKLEQYSAYLKECTKLSSSFWSRLS
jgi:hypothetical protein